VSSKPAAAQKGNYNRCERRNGMLVCFQKLPNTFLPKGQHAQEIGGTFLKGFIGLIELILGYAGIKRFSGIDSPNQPEPRKREKKP
jgi:hypothetical protein